MLTFLSIVFIIYIIIKYSEIKSKKNNSSKYEKFNYENIDRKKIDEYLKREKEDSQLLEKEFNIIKENIRREKNTNILASNTTNNIIKSNDIKKYIQERNIKTLFHFTRLNNLDSILKHGIIPRNIVRSVTNNNIVFNDDYRFDNRVDTISLSVSYPNYKMFFKYRELNPDVQWVVIGLKASVLYEKICLFCFTNAANKKISSLHDDYLVGIDALKKLFTRQKEDDISLPLEFPSDPQAEILVKEKIETNYIKFIHTNNKKYKNNKIEYDDRYFNSRDYYLNKYYNKF